MRCLRYFLSSLTLMAFTSPLSAAYPQDTELRRPNDSPSSPARPFTVRAFAYSFAVTGLPGPELTGLPMIARGGNFYLDSSNSTSDSNAPVLSVDATSRAYLYNVGGGGGHLAFIDTANGRFGYSGGDGGEMPAGAMVVNFVHRWSGTAFFDEQYGYLTAPPATLEWDGYGGWYACRQGNEQDYQLFKWTPISGSVAVSVDVLRNQYKCESVTLAAIDYSGPSLSI